MPNNETAIDHGRIVFHAQWNEVIRLRRTVLDTWELEDIHDLRVASRRFMAALNLFGPFASPKRVATLQKHVRTLTRALGELRNIDEARAFFTSNLPPEICPKGSKNRSVVAILADMRKHEVGRVKKALKAFKPKKLDPLVQGIVAGLAEDAAPELSVAAFPSYLSNISLKLFQRIHDQLATAMAPENTKARHTLRIAVKKWRYFIEIAASIFGSDDRVELERLKNYQSVLGRMNDMAEFSALCRDLKLSSAEQHAVEDALRRESDLLWKLFLGLMKKQPLRHTFHPDPTSAVRSGSVRSPRAVVHSLT